MSTDQTGIKVKVKVILLKSIFFFFLSLRHIVGNFPGLNMYSARSKEQNRMAKKEAQNKFAEGEYHGNKNTF